ncbi:hypothetical protein [Streptomyces sp. NPDC059176]|uniref:hypothetical protein n=1 Tax=Streptomyces sp. NPDC059176 TaxID=3346758 RepID=UPI00367F3A9D
MTPDETVVLARYVRALCPQQKFDEYTPDAWHDVLGEYRLDEARAAAARVAKKQPFVSPAEIIDEITQIRGDRARDIQGPGQPAAVPDADPDDVHAYLAALRQQRMRAADGLELKPRNIKALTARLGEMPAEEKPPRTGLDVDCPRCGAKRLRACQSDGRRLAFLHPSRQEQARRIAAGQEPIDADAERREADRRRAASAAWLAAHQTETDQEEAS